MCILLVYVLRLHLHSLSAIPPEEDKSECVLNTGTKTIFQQLSRERQDQN